VIGFTNPQFGSFKSEIAVVGRDTEARVAYEACDNVHAKEFDMCGYTVSVRADEAKAGGDRRFVFCIAESLPNSQPNKGDVLTAGEYLTPGQFLLSRNGQFAACYLLRKGQLAVYDLKEMRRSVWSTGSATRSSWRAGLNADGTFAVFEEDGRTVWSAPTKAPGGFIHLTDSGQLTLLDHMKHRVWASQ
jgi:hypothetical protein